MSPSVHWRCIDGAEKKQCKAHFVKSDDISIALNLPLIRISSGRCIMAACMSLKEVLIVPPGDICLKTYLHFSRVSSSSLYVGFCGECLCVCSYTERQMYAGRCVHAILTDLQGCQPRYAPLCSLQTQQLSLHLPSVSDAALRPLCPAAFLMDLIITYCRSNQWYLLNVSWCRDPGVLFPSPFLLSCPFLCSFYLAGY